MSRLPDWRERLNLVISEARVLQFALGTHDCMTFALSAWQAVYGDDLRRRLHGVSYSSTRDAVREIARHGSSAEAAADWLFGKRVPINQALAGNVAIYTGPSGLKHLAVVDHGILTFTDRGMVRAPLRMAHVAWSADE